jgi:hypothetical protein
LPEASIEPALIVRVTVALPLASNLTEFELNEQLGAPAPEGCTKQESETGKLKELSCFRLTVELALWPACSRLGLGVVIEVEKSDPVLFRDIPTLGEMPPPGLATTTSGALSPLASTAAAFATIPGLGGASQRR